MPDEHTNRSQSATFSPGPQLPAKDGYEPQPTAAHRSALRGWCVSRGRTAALMAESFETKVAGPAGAAELELTAELRDARDLVAELRHRLGELQSAAVRCQALVELDIGRALVALDAAGRALERAHRHAGLAEPA